MILVLLLCPFGGCAESNRQPIQGNSGVVRYPSSEPHVLDATPRDYAAPYMASTPWEVLTHCNNLPTQYMTNLCEFARAQGVTMQQAEGVWTLAGMEAVAKLCGFTVTDNFKAARNDVLTQIANGKAIYDNLVNMFRPDAIYDVPVWCKQRYTEIGPASQWKFFK